MSNNMKARIRWDKTDNTWVLELWDKTEWVFSKVWKVIVGDEAHTGDYVHDSILCEIAHLQYIGYKVEVKL